LCGFVLNSPISLYDERGLFALVVNLVESRITEILEEQPNPVQQAIDLIGTLIADRGLPAPLIFTRSCLCDVVICAPAKNGVTYFVFKTWNPRRIQEVLPNYFASLDEAWRGMTANIAANMVKAKIRRRLTDDDCRRACEELVAHVNESSAMQ